VVTACAAVLSLIHPSLLLWLYLTCLCCPGGISCLAFLVGEDNVKSAPVDLSKVSFKGLWVTLVYNITENNPSASSSGPHGSYSLAQ